MSAKIEDFARLNEALADLEDAIEKGSRARGHLLVACAAAQLIADREGVPGPLEAILGRHPVVPVSSAP